MYCRYCGNELGDDDKICKKCMVSVNSKEIQKEEQNHSLIKKSSKMRIGAWAILLAVSLLGVGMIVMYRDASESDNDLDVGEGYIGAGGNWADEYIENVANKNGNTLANLYNSGWVAEHGDWVYFAFNGYILKENVLTGEKVQVYNFGSEDIDITGLSVIGEYVYFIHEEYGLCRTKTNGTEYQYLRDFVNLNWVGSDLMAWIYDGCFYQIGTENITASTYDYFLEKVNLDDGTVERLIGVGDGLSLIGVMDNYAFFYKTYYSSSYDDYDKMNYVYLKVSLEDYSVKQCSLKVSDDFCTVSNPYLADGEIITITRELYQSPQIAYITDFENESMEKYAYFEKNLTGGNVNFVDNKIIYGQSEILLSDVQGCIMMIDKKGNETQVVPDEPSENSLCVAHGQIYYRYGKGAYRVNPDGIGFEEIDVNDFDYIYH